MSRHTVPLGKVVIIDRPEEFMKGLAGVFFKQSGQSEDYFLAAIDAETNRLQIWHREWYTSTGIPYFHIATANEHAAFVEKLRACDDHHGLTENEYNQFLAPLLQGGKDA